MVVTISHAGYVKRTPVSEYRSQKRGGKGKVGMEARDEDWVSQLFVASTHSVRLLLQRQGQGLRQEGLRDPRGARNAKGRAIVNFVGVEPGEKIAAITPVPGFEPGIFVVTLTKKGQIKKTAVEEYENYREKGIIGVKIEDGDQLLTAAITDGTAELLVATRGGMSIRFPEEQVRPMGRGTVGVKGVELDPPAEDGDRRRRGPLRLREGPERRRLPRSGAGGVRARLRQADPHRRVSPAEPRRQGRHPDRRERSQRPRGGRVDRGAHRRGAPRHRSWVRCFARASPRSARRAATPRACAS
jgi:DNA gyrase/topoisomerase IV subunit A